MGLARTSLLLGLFKVKTKEHLFCEGGDSISWGLEDKNDNKKKCGKKRY